MTDSERFYHTDKSVKEYIKLAEGYDGREIIDKLKLFLPEDSTVLELGSGPGVDLAILRNSFLVTASDFSKIFLQLIADQQPDVDLLHLDAVTMDTDRSFDCVYSNKVLQHLTDDELKDSITKQVNTLNPGGIICHTFWNGTDSYEMQGMLQNYHTKSELEDFFSDYFEILLLEIYEEMEPEDSLLIIGTKK